MGKQTLSVAEELYRGHASHAGGLRASNGRPGVPCMIPTKVSLGSPATADADGFCASQDLTTADVASIDTTGAGAIAAAALAGINPQPRNVVAAWTSAAVITITGTDAYGAAMSEASGSGTSFTGKKAFKTVTNIAVSGNVTGLTVGQGQVLGLPYKLTDLADIIQCVFNGVIDATPGGVVAVTTTATTTTGDVRGSVAPATLNGSPVVIWMYVQETDTVPDLIGVGQA
jgi:hypothetical protein